MNKNLSIWNKYLKANPSKRNLSKKIILKMSKNVDSDEILEEEDQNLNITHKSSDIIDSNGFSTQDLTIMKSSPRLSDPASTKSLSIDLLSILLDRKKANKRQKLIQLDCFALYVD